MAAIKGALKSQVQLIDELKRTKEMTDLCADSSPHYRKFHPSRVDSNP
jgi:hypothetical protein